MTFTTKRILLTILAFSFFFNVFGQNESDKSKAKNSVYIEMFGNAGDFYNITYDRLVHSKGNNNISTGLGIQYFPSSDLSAPDDIFSISPQINYFYGIRHHFETGLGLAYDFNSGDLIIPFRIGYRFQKHDGGLFCKVGFTPFLTRSYPIFGDGFSLIPWGGLAIGWTF